MMSKNIIFCIFLLSICSLSWAEVTIDHCLTTAEFNAHHLNPQVVPTECKNIVKNHAGIFERIQTSDGLYDVYGHKNMLYVDYYQEVDGQLSLVDSKLLAGDQTKLREIISLDLDEENKKIFILNRNHDTVSFAHYSLDFIGNVAPSRHYQSSEINGAVSFRVSTSDDKTYNLDYQNAQIKVYNLHADPEGKNANNAINIQKSIAGVQTLLVSPVDLALSEQEIFVLDGDRVLVFVKSAQGDVSPVRIIYGDNTQLNSAKMINLDLDANEILIFNGDGQTLRFHLNASGNISPLP